MRSYGVATFALLLVVWGSALSAAGESAADNGERIYELRTYTTAPGKLDALHARFRNHTMKLFRKHGITNVGYWVPIDNPEGKLVYIVSFPSVAARQRAWKEFSADPEWQKVFRESRQKAGGPIVTKVESIRMKRTDFSPPVRSEQKRDRVFELRIYTTREGCLPILLARFRDHTMKLFDKHGISNVAYWVPIEGQPTSGHTLIYMLAHRSREAARRSFASFLRDPAWIAARDASRQKAGGPLLVRDGIKSVFLKPTDYSPFK